MAETYRYGMQRFSSIDKPTLLLGIVVPCLLSMTNGGTIGHDFAALRALAIMALAIRTGSASDVTCSSTAVTFL
jgi:hypothetical protein